MAVVAACAGASLVDVAKFCVWGGMLCADAVKGAAWEGSAAVGGGNVAVGEAAVNGSRTGSGKRSGKGSGEGSGEAGEGAGGVASVAMRVCGATFWGGMGAGTAAAGGGTQRVCMGPLRTSLSFGKRRSSVPDTLSSAKTCATSTLSTSAAKVRREGGPAKRALSGAAGDERLVDISPTTPNRPTVAGQTGASAGRSAPPMRCRAWQ